MPAVTDEAVINQLSYPIDQIFTQTTYPAPFLIMAAMSETEGVAKIKPAIVFDIDGGAPSTHCHRFYLYQ